MPHDEKASRYGDAWHEVYDDWHPLDGSAISAIRTLTGLANDGRVLELGIGTGRLAIPLAKRGVDVHGVEASPQMIDRLRAKAGGLDIPVTLGDMRDVPVDGSFDLVVVAANTFFCLLTQDDQVQCFENVACHLVHDGLFVIECFVPGRDHPTVGSRVTPWALAGDEARIHAAQADPVTQRIQASTVSMSEGKVARVIPLELRYAWPSELDLMARLASLRLHRRWDGWDRRPFTAGSNSHVSVYQKGR